MRTDAVSIRVLLLLLDRASSAAVARVFLQRHSLQDGVAADSLLTDSFFFYRLTVPYSLGRVQCTM